MKHDQRTCKVEPAALVFTEDEIEKNNLQKIETTEKKKRGLMYKDTKSKQTQKNRNQETQRYMYIACGKLRLTRIA